MYCIIRFAYLFLHFLFHDASGDPENCFEASRFLISETGLGAVKFWGAQAQDVEQCMKLCVRQKQCKSINYDLKTRMCELNKNFRRGKQKASKSNVYSEFRSWPHEVDKYCFTRPCGMNEVCVPKKLLMPSHDGDCSYSCLQFSRPVCPLPEIGTSNGRGVGSVNTVECPKGTTGGGSATCQPNLKWDKEIPKCVGFRLKSESQNVTDILQTNYDGEWKDVARDGWNWKKTQVACRDLFNLEYGGTYSSKSTNGNKIAVDIDCNGIEETLAACDFKGTKKSTKSIFDISCFKFNITDGGSFEHITLSSDSSSILNQAAPSETDKDFLWVKYSEAWLPVVKECNSGRKWGSKETTVACRSMFPHAPNKKQKDEFAKNGNSARYITFTCEGDEHHLLNCLIRICNFATNGELKQVKLQCNRSYF